MARVTVEDCIDKVENRFELVLLASHRARMVSSGSQITVDRDNDKNPVVALREIAETTISPGDLKEDLIHSLQKYVEVDEPEPEAPLIGTLRFGRCRRHRCRHGTHERGGAAEGTGGSDPARGAARGRGIARSRSCTTQRPGFAGPFCFLTLLFSTLGRPCSCDKRRDMHSCRRRGIRRPERIMARSNPQLPRMQNQARTRAPLDLAGAAPASDPVGKAASGRPSRR